VKHDPEASGLAFTGDPELIRLAFDCGVGSKNSQGFGMIEIAAEEPD
jgi:CRISPR/Cas system endoribonuclease Cas6 (RAMP superfamily)